MAKKPKLRMTNADYVAIAVSPALIMALVGSLVFFLIEVLYVGQYQARLMYVFALFVFATVLIGRISIEMGADRAALFALPLAIAMFLVLAKFVQHASPYSHLINVALLGIVWWSAHKLTWDCTLIDDNEDASGEGLMQRIGADEFDPDAEEPDTTDNELFSHVPLPANGEGAAAGNSAKYPSPSRRGGPAKPHTPGLWVLYFSLAALPLFGIGQKWIPASDVGRRQYAFGLLAVYVAAGLTLLVTTSFLGLRRYLRQRRIEMPTPMAATWVVTGAILIVVVMLLAAVIPRPQAEYAISQVPWQVTSPPEVQSNRMSVGNDGADDENLDARQVVNGQTDPEATATREGDEPTTTSEEGKQQTSGGESSNEDSPTGEQGDSSESGESETDSQQPSEKSESTEEGETSQSNQQPDESSDDAASSAETSEQDSQTPRESNSDAPSKSSQPARSLPNLLPQLGGLANAVKLLLYAIVGLVLLFAAWKHRQQIARAISEFVHQIRDFLRQLFGGKAAKPTSATDEELEEVKGPLHQAFASFSDPFASGKHRSMPPDEVVRYTFEAFEAWARERGHPRSPDQTLLELTRRAIPKESPMLAEAGLLVRLYNEAAYSPKTVSRSAVEGLAKLWSSMNAAAQTPLEPIS